MKRIICKREYNTETAELVKKVTFGAWGDTNGYEETLYITADGHYFLYVNGGADSFHPVEKLTRKSKETAAAWLEK